MADTIRYANFRKDDSPGEAFFMGGIVMGKHQQECDYLAMIASQAEEIEQLNAQVAMLRHNIAWMSGLVENWSGEENGHHDRIMSQSSDEWLADHDAKVRDDALEEAAKNINECGTYYAFDSNGDIIGYAEEFIRSMKGKS